LTDTQLAFEPMRHAYRARPYPQGAAVFAMAPYFPGPTELGAIIQGGVQWFELGGIHGEEMDEPYVTRIAGVLQAMVGPAS